MELKDTAALMTSTDYKERFKAEYWQVRDRFLKLTVMLNKWDAGELDFTPDCPRELLDRQIRAMAEYIGILKERAAIEKVTL